MCIIEKKSLSVGKYVSTEHVDTVIRTYKKERWVHNSERLGKADSLSGWLSVEELEAFIETVKQHDADGVKFYFGAYSQESAPRPEYAGLQTIVLVATKNKETVNGTTNKDVYITKNGSSVILAYNSVYLCPPFCGGGSTFKPDTELNGIGVALLDKGDKGMAVI
jgi:hypothetical protein